MALHAMHWAHSVITHSQPEIIELVSQLLGHRLKLKSLIFQLLVVGGYDLLSSATVIRTFGAGGVDGNIWDLLSVFACCSFLASLNLFILYSDRTGASEQLILHPFSFAGLTFACGFPAGGMVFCVMKLLMG
jgi:hypothetical protein